MGAVRNCLEHAYNNNANTSENIQVAESRCSDADMAEERWNILRIIFLSSKNINAYAGKSEFLGNIGIVFERKCGMKVIIILIISLGVAIWINYDNRITKALKIVITALDIACMVISIGISFQSEKVADKSNNEESIIETLKNTQETNGVSNIDDTIETEIMTTTNSSQINIQKETKEHTKCIAFIGESHSPSDAATKVNISQWKKNEDYDLTGNTYDGGQKITIYNMFSATEGNSGKSIYKIISEIHYALNVDEINKLNEEDQHFVGKFVIDNKTDGSPTTATISILTDGEEVYNSELLNCYSLDINPFDVELQGKKEMIIKIECEQRGNPFIIGMVNNE